MRREQGPVAAHEVMEGRMGRGRRERNQVETSVGSVDASARDGIGRRAVSTRKPKAPMCVKCGERPEIGPANHLCEPCCLESVWTNLGQQLEKRLEAWNERADDFLKTYGPQSPPAEPTKCTEVCLMKTRLIALTGLAGSGKNTVADMLGGHHLSFAEPLKWFAQEVFAFSDAQLYGPSAERNKPDERYPREHGPWVHPPTPCPGKCCAGACACCGARTHETRATAAHPWPTAPTCHLTSRYALQTLGTEWGRNCYPDVWASLGVRRALAHLDEHPHDFVVITDCRHLNEAKAVRAAGGQVWRIVRPGAGIGTAHPSEAEQQSGAFLACVDVTIHNDDTLEHLRDWVHVASGRLGLGVH